MEKQDFIEQLADNFYLFKEPAMPGLPFSIPYILYETPTKGSAWKSFIFCCGRKPYHAPAMPVIEEKKCILMDAGVCTTDKEESHAIH